jgi:hypothetical protein
VCRGPRSATFGGVGGYVDLEIPSDSNNTNCWCRANLPSFNLPVAPGSKGPSMNGGEINFQLKEFEVYSVKVSMMRY